ncbi:MAG: hypothetical protein JWO09_2126 [Bacteroidetes bacterium]|nr:hypothetical protein [Bacteroidota bacterium]
MQCIPFFVCYIIMIKHNSFNNPLKLALLLLCFCIAEISTAQELIPYKTGRFWGFCRGEKSNILIAPCFSGFRYFSYMSGETRNDMYIVGGAKELFGVVDTEGKLIVDTIYTMLEVISWPDAPEALFYALKPDGRVAVTDIRGRVLIPSAHRSVEPVQLSWNDTVRNVFIEHLNDSSFVYDPGYRLLVRAKGYIEGYYSGYWLNSIRKREKTLTRAVYGLLDSSGRTVQPVKYSFIDPLGMYNRDGQPTREYKGVLRLETAKGCYLFSTVTHKRSPAFGRQVYPVSDSLYLAEAPQKKHQQRLFNINTNEYVRMEGSGNYTLEQIRGERQSVFVLQKDKRTGVINDDGKIIIPPLKDAYYDIEWAFDNRLNVKQWTRTGDTIYCYDHEGTLYERQYMKDTLSEAQLYMKASGLKYSYNRILNKQGKLLLSATADAQLYYLSLPFSGDTLIAYTERGDGSVKLYKVFEEALLIDSSAGLSVLPGNYIQLYTNYGQNVKILDSMLRKVMEVQYLQAMSFGYYAYNKGRSYTYDHSFHLIHEDEKGFIFGEQWLGGIPGIGGFCVMDPLTGKPAGNEVYERNYQVSNALWIVKKNGCYFLTDHKLKVLFCFHDSLSAMNRKYVDRICARYFFDPYIPDAKAYELLMNNDTVSYAPAGSWWHLPSYISTVKNGRLNIYDSLGTVLFSCQLAKAKDQLPKASVPFGNGNIVYGDSAAFLVPGAVKCVKADTANYVKGYTFSDHSRFFFLNQRPEDAKSRNTECDMFDMETGRLVFSGISDCQNCDAHESHPYKVFRQAGVYKLLNKEGAVMMEQKEKFMIIPHSNGRTVVARTYSYPPTSEGIIGFIDDNGNLAADEK